MQHARQFFIDGKWTDPIDGTDFPVIDPSTEEVCETISLGGKADAAAVAKAITGQHCNGYHFFRLGKEKTQ